MSSKNVLTLHSFLVVLFLALKDCNFLNDYNGTLVFLTKSTYFYIFASEHIMICSSVCFIHIFITGFAIRCKSFALISFFSSYKFYFFR